VAPSRIVDVAASDISPYTISSNYFDFLRAGKVLRVEKSGYYTLAVNLAEY